MQQRNDTIVAISTPPGRGGIGIARLSGPQARSIAEFLVRLKHPLEPGRVRFAEVLDRSAEPAVVLDEAVVTWFASPHSYTNEDVVEIACHGGILVTRKILQLLLARGARELMRG